MYFVDGVRRRMYGGDSLCKPPPSMTLRGVRPLGSTRIYSVSIPSAVFRRSDSLGFTNPDIGSHPYR